MVTKQFLALLLSMYLCVEGDSAKKCVTIGRGNEVCYYKRKERLF